MRKSERIAGTSPLAPPGAGAGAGDGDVPPPPIARGDAIAPAARRAWGYPAPIFRSFEWCLPDD